MTILQEVKNSIGYYGDEYDSFDADVLRSINTATLILFRIGALKQRIIVTNSSEWLDVLANNSSYSEMIKDYICRKTRILFDPPQQSNTYKAYEDSIKELEWTLQEDRK